MTHKDMLFFRVFVINALDSCDSPRRFLETSDALVRNNCEQRCFLYPMSTPTEVERTSLAGSAIINSSPVV